MNNPVDAILNHMTMYRLVLFYVIALLLAAFLGGLFSLVDLDPARLAFSATVIAGTCFAANIAFARALRVPVNSESVWITAAMIVLLMPPVAPHDRAGVVGLVVAALAAIASKYLLAVRRRHVFNPVAFGVVASAYLLDQPATWWIDGNLLFVACVVVGGLLVVRKVRRFAMVGAYLAANLAVTLATTPPEMMLDALQFTVVYSPLLFAGFAMLTEPLTAPQTTRPALVYGVLVGVLSSPNVHFGGFYPTPEIALLIGNIFAFAVNPAPRVKLTLVAIEKTAKGCYDFVFRPDRPVGFRPGQYLDWTLAVANPDSRGNRRPFTIASAPGESAIRLGVKFHPRPSSYKRALAALGPGATVYGSPVAGNFVLPRSQEAKLAFIAGGIGITPFRSMVQDMMHRGDCRPTVLFYGNNTSDEIAYRHVFDEARRRIGLRTIYAVADATTDDAIDHCGFIDRSLIVSAMPDYDERVFFISGPQAMVMHFRTVLRELGIPARRIRTDYFPGFA